MVCELWSDADTFLFYLCTGSHHPEDGNTSGRNVFVTAMK